MKTLTAKEKEFCSLFVLFGNEREAALKAGYSSPESQGLKLVKRTEIVEEIERITAIEDKRQAIAGLKRIAFGTVSDAVKLLTNELTENEIDKLDLFMVSEIKFAKNGGMEVKFFDRIKALERLAQMGSDHLEDQENRFINAIAKGVDGLNQNGWSDEI